ncbi:unnamed protein product [Oppiella nova]|uniref:Uncharacterized protein n=1 Tax=Oppiella nova TaxID=334625 RepID=A0A7R9MKS8_9ACAR|nr:unnamed protein product [Oppiella nova]CAG2179091.1 unnamed protein product [Oppiella nova]
MGIVKKSLKLGTALGVTYLTVEQRLWSQLSHKDIDAKLVIVTKYGQQVQTFVTQKTGVDVKQWKPYTLQSYDPKSVWNRLVKTGFRTSADFRLKPFITKVQKLLETTTK